MAAYVFGNIPISMKVFDSQNSVFLITTLIILISFSASAAHAQSQAQNGQIEGRVFDQRKSAVSGAVVIVTNLGTTSSRSVTTDMSGIYSVPLLPLGTYRVTAEASGFKRFVREGVILATGQSATVDLQLEPGDVEETVTVSSDSSIADMSKIDIGRVMNSREVHNVPLATRNPYNFVILQAGVTGRPNRGFNYPQVNVNGYARRVNYLLDGNTNTKGDRAGARLLMVSETYVSETQLLTNGFAAEFGNTTGMIVNMVTPSGTNNLRGSVLYLFRRPGFYARPFFFSAPELPENATNNVAATLGGPILKSRLHYYFGYEYIRRDDNTRANRQVTISEVNKSALVAIGLPASIFVPSIPSQEFGSHFIFRTDAEIDHGNHLTARFNHADVGTKNGIVGGLNTLERSIDVTTVDHSVAVQLASYNSKFLNEARFQFVRSVTANLRNQYSGTGPSVTISNVANFGSPIDDDLVDKLSITQMQDNYTWNRDSHLVKLGGGVSIRQQNTRASVLSLFIFRTVNAFEAAQNGSDPYSYERYQESFGDPDTRINSNYWNFFIQDDWKASRRLKINYGLRYDFYGVPDADQSSSLQVSRKFNAQPDNVSPRVGIVFPILNGKRPLVLRAGAGLYYESPWTLMYERAIRENGNRFYTLQFCGNNGETCQPALAPPFPLTFSGTRPPGSVLPPQDIVTVAPDFDNMYAIHSHLQLEQALTDDTSLSVGYIHSDGRHIPVYRSINHVYPVSYLADGRPVFGTTHLDSRFNVIQMAESGGVSHYDALTVQIAQRFSHGLQFSASYSLSRAVDDAPEQNVTYMGLGGVSITSLVVSDPTDRSLDKGYSYGDQRHTFVMSLVASPEFRVRNSSLACIINHNQLSTIVTVNSGERFNILAGREINGTFSNLDLNRDGVSTADRPVGIRRNSGKTPSQFNLDLRYSRFIHVTERYGIEAFLEVQNLFNINSIIGYSNVNVSTDPLTGIMIGPLPNFKNRNQSVSLESRQAQIGLKFNF